MHEERFGTPEEIQKVEAMKPSRGKRRHIEQETGRMVEGKFSSSFIIVSIDINLSQIGNGFSLTTSERPIQHLSSSYRLHMHGRKLRK